MTGVAPSQWAVAPTWVGGRAHAILPPGAMDHATLEAMKRSHPGWRLLAADHARMIIGFLHHTFTHPNVHTVPQAESLVAQLDDWLYGLRQRGDADAYPRTAGQYLDIWADDEHGWLRKYYPPDGDEPWFDIAPATEKAIEWLADLRRRQFVGTESRLIIRVRALAPDDRGHGARYLQPASRS